MSYYFDEIIKGTKINFSNSLLDKKKIQKTPPGWKQLCIRFDKIDGFILYLDGKIEHLTSLDHGLFKKICNKIKYPISKKGGITNSINHNFGKIRIVSMNYFSVRKILTFYTH